MWSVRWEGGEGGEIGVLDRDQSFIGYVANGANDLLPQTVYRSAERRTRARDPVLDRDQSLQVTLQMVRTVYCLRRYIVREGQLSRVTTMLGE